jgi:hypothetical protein
VWPFKRECPSGCECAVCVDGKMDKCEANREFILKYNNKLKKYFTDS